MTSENNYIGFSAANHCKSTKEGIGVWGVTVGDDHIQFFGRKSMIGPCIQKYYNTSDYQVGMFLPRGKQKIVIDIDNHYKLEYRYVKNLSKFHGKIPSL